jgi:dUTP pyrophosphatase
MSAFPTINTLPIAHLKMYIDSEDSEWKQKYAEHVKQHNDHIATDPFPNSGFDLLTPTDTHIMPDSLLTSVFLDLRIKTEMTFGTLPAAYYVFVRSSFSKTPLILSNHVGIIDSGYRGNLKAALRNLQATTSFIGGYKLEKNSKIVQICHPLLCPIHVEIVETESELSTTARAGGGFGSTGK